MSTDDYPDALMLSHMSARFTRPLKSSLIFKLLMFMLSNVQFPVTVTLMVIF